MTNEKWVQKSTLATSLLSCCCERRHSTVSSCKNVRHQQRSNRQRYPRSRRHHAAEGEPHTNTPQKNGWPTLAESGARSDLTQNAESDPLQAAQELVRKVNVIPNAASFASHIQIAEHVDDPTAEDFRAQGNAELWEAPELDKFFEKVRDVRGTVVLDHSFSKCKQLMPEIYDCAKDGVFNRHACNTLPTICSPSCTSEGEDTCFAIKKKEAQPMRARTGRQPIGTFRESSSVPHVAQIARFSPVLSPSESGRQRSTKCVLVSSFLVICMCKLPRRHKSKIHDVIGPHGTRSFRPMW